MCILYIYIYIYIYINRIVWTAGGQSTLGGAVKREKAPETALARSTSTSTGSLSDKAERR